MDITSFYVWLRVFKFFLSLLYLGKVIFILAVLSELVQLNHRMELYGKESHDYSGL